MRISGRSDQAWSVGRHGERRVGSPGVFALSSARADCQRCGVREGHAVSVALARDIVSLNTVFHDVRDFLRRFVYFTNEGDAVIVALWIAHTYAYRQFNRTPYLFVHADDPQCGKSTLLDVVEVLIPGSIKVSSATKAALCRATEGGFKVVLFDEVHRTLGKKQRGGERDELVAALNDGYAKGGQVLLTESIGDSNKHRARPLEVFYPKILAGRKNRMPLDDLDDLFTRCIPIPMTAKPRNSTLELFDQDAVEREASRLREQLEQSLSGVSLNVKPSFPDALDWRQQDNYRPLFSIADYAGGDWPEMIRRASRIASADRAPEVTVELLQDARAVLNDYSHRNVFSAELLRRLKAHDQRWSRLDQVALAELLRPVKVFSDTRTIKGKQAKGYRMADLQQAWDVHAA